MTGGPRGNDQTREVHQPLLKEHRRGDVLLSACLSALHPIALELMDGLQLCGLAETVWSVPQLLERKIGAYRRLDWRRMVQDDPYIDHKVRPSFVVKQADVSFQEMLQRLGFSGHE